MKNSSFLSALRRHRKLMIVLVTICLAILIDISAIILHQAKKQTNVQIVNTSSQNTSSKLWQVTFSFNQQTGRLVVKNIAVKKGITIPSTLHTSPYRLYILNKQQQILFQTDLHIAEHILYDVYFPPGTSANQEDLQQLQQIDTVINIPYFSDATSIIVTKNGTEILQFIPPKEISLQFITQAFANICSKLHIVFISDGYNDMNKFHQDVQRAENTFRSKEPFASNAEIFDFQTIDNPATNALGCNQHNTLRVTCIGTYDTQSKAVGLVSEKFSNLPLDDTYTKIVILVDGNPQPAGNGYILGVANTLGGQFGVFQNRLYFEPTATMEVLGHDVGQLYDRYMYPPNSQPAQIGGSIAAPFLTNCTTNPQGEAFWKNAGATQAYKGCTSNFLYAPAPRDCGDAGSSTTIMSQVQCAGSQFDTVEQYWLKTNIIPLYKCTTNAPPISLAPTVSQQTSSPTGNPSLSPSTVETFPNPTNASNQQTSPQAFDCEPDPSCVSGKGSLQLCPLKCTPK